MCRIMQLTKLSIVFFIISISNCLAQQEDDLKQSDYNFQTQDFLIHPFLQKDYVAIKTVKLTTPLYPKHRYRVTFSLKSNIAVNSNRGRNIYPVMLFPSNFIDKTVYKQSTKVVSSESILPRFAIGTDAVFYGEKSFSFIVEPDRVYERLTIALKDSSFNNPLFDIKSGVSANGVFIQLLKEKQIINKLPITIAGRTIVNKGEDLILTDSLVTIEIYDHKKVDGDIVSLYLNENKIVDKEELTKKKKKFEFVLDKSKNIIILHAENLGEQPPNTMAVIIKTKNEKYKKILSSDLNQSECFTLIMTEL